MSDEISTKPRYIDLSAFKAKLMEKNGRGRREKYPWSSMKVDDSFFIDGKDARISSVRSMASAKGRDLEKRFSVTIGPGGGSYVTREE